MSRVESAVGQGTPPGNDRWADPRMPLLVGAAAAALAWFTDGGGLTWDEAYYHPAYLDVAGWLGALLQHPLHTLGNEGISLGWARIHELPPVTKWLGAFCVALPVQGALVLKAMRLFPALCHGATVGLLQDLARRRLGGATALAVAGLYALHPQAFGYAHYAGSEAVFAMLTALVLWIAGALPPGRRATVGLGIVMGLALATKVNAVFLMAAVVLSRLARGDGRARGREFAAWAVLVPVVAWTCWPWMWHSPGARLLEYVDFVRHHSHQGAWYLGEKWNFAAPPAPWHYPLVMLAVTSPEPFLLLGLGGAALVLARWGRSAGHESRDALLPLLLVALPLGAACLPGTPKYDGIRLFFPVLVPLAFLAGLSLQAMSSRWRVAALTVAFAASVPFLGRGIDFYNLSTRALCPSGDDFPFEETFWGQGIDRDVLNALNQKTPPNGRILTRAIHDEALLQQQRWGLLRADIQLVGEPPADFHLVQNRKGFWGEADWWLRTNRKPLAVFPSESDPKVFLFDGRPVGVGE